MPATCYDAVDVPAIPQAAMVVLAYVDGQYVTYPAVKARFPLAHILTITTTGKNKADIADVESGDLTPETGAEVYRQGIVRALYSDTSTHPALLAAVGEVFPWWAADPTGVPHIVSGAIATQWAWPGHGSPGNYDISWVLESWLAPAPPFIPSEEDTMPLYATNSQGTGFVIATDLSSKTGIPDGADAGVLLATGLYKTVKLTDQLINDIPNG